MMWIRLSSNQTVEIELFGASEAEGNSQFALDMRPSASFRLAESNKEEANNLDPKEPRYLKFF